MSRMSSETKTDQPQRKMPVLRLHQPQKRSSTGITITIILGTVAGLVIAACFIWGIAVPWIRKQCARKSTNNQNQWTDSMALTESRRSRLKRTYPNHPAVRPLLSKPSATNSVKIYDPRTESPFVDGPAIHSTRFPSTRSLRAQSTPPLSASASSNGLFTPVKRSDIENDDSRSRFHTVPRATDARHLPVKSSDFGDAKDFILAVPEPLALKPRDAGRPPPIPVARHLDRYGTSLASLTASPAHSDRLLHPNKLFRNLPQPDIRSSLCSSTSMQIDHRQSDGVTAPSSKDAVDSSYKAIHEEHGRNWFKADVDYEADKEDLTDTKVHAQNKDLADEHRFRSYQNLTAGETANGVRSDTISQPKMPVGDLRTLFNQDQRDVTLASVQAPLQGTAPTLFANTDFGSDYDSSSTPATSPVMYPSNVCLLPDPLSLRKSSEPESIHDRLTPHQPRVDVCGGQSSSNVPSILIGDRAGNSSNARGFHHTGRRLTKPAPLDIGHSSKETTLDNRHSRNSFTEFRQAVFGPLIKSNTMRSRARASSLYSRDTHGVSMVNTPITPDFPTPASETFTNPSVCGNPFKAPASVQARIDDWTQRIEGQVAPPLPPIRHVSPFFAASRNVSKIVLENTEDDLVETDAGVVSGEAHTVKHDQEKDECDIGEIEGPKWI